jgi:hypothetical protein
MLPFYAGVLVVAGIGFSALVARAARPAQVGRCTPRRDRVACQLGWQAWRASVTYAPTRESLRLRADRP